MGVTLVLTSAAAAGAADRSIGAAASGPVPGTAAPRVPTAADVDRSAWVPSADSATAEVSGAAAGAACRGTEVIMEPYPRSGPLGILRPSHLVVNFVTGDVVLRRVRGPGPGPDRSPSEFCDRLISSQISSLAT